MNNPESLVGKELNEFLLVEYIAHGAMGLVYKAKDTKMDRHVALKLVSKKIDLAPAMSEARKRLKTEAQASGRLSHPNIVTVHGWGETEEFLYICMEYVYGKTLSQILYERKVIEAQEALSWFEQILMALEVAAEERIVHRDIKPANIMVMKGNRIKVMDFGIAKMPTTHLTMTGTVLGTPYYMSPEQISGQDVDIRSDIFSLGAVLYQTLTGQKPFEGENAVVLTYKVIHTEPIPPRVLNILIPEALENICLKALVKDPKLRYQTPTEMLHEIRVLIRTEPVSPTASIPINRLDMEATLAAPAASLPGITREHSTQLPPPVFGIPDENGGSALAVRDKEISDHVKAVLQPEKPKIPLKRFLIASTLTLITAVGGFVAVRQFDNGTKQPNIATKDNTEENLQGKTLDSGVPEIESPNPPQIAVQPKKSVETLIRQAKTIMAAKPSEAMNLLEDAVSLEPNNLEAVSELAKLMEQTKDHSAAIEQYKKAVGLNGKDPDLHFKLAMLYLAQGDQEHALKSLEACLALSPSNKEEVLTNIGMIYTKRADPSQALGYFKEAVDLNPKNESTSKLLKETMGSLVVQAREQAKASPGNARKMLERVLGVEPAHYEASLELAKLMEQTKDHPAAIEQYKKAVGLNGKDPDLHFKLAMLYLAQGDQEHALKSLEACLALSPSNKEEVLTNIGMIYTKRADPSQALGYFKEAVDLNNKNQTARRLLSESISKLVADAKEQLHTNQDNARMLLEKALSFDAGDFEASFQLARLFTFKKDFNAAIPLYKKALTLNKQSADAYFNLGYIYVMQGNYDRAIENYEACRKLSPAYQDEVLTNLGIIYYERNNISQAQGSFKEALEINPNNENAKKYLSSLNIDQ